MLASLMEVMGLAVILGLLGMSIWLVWSLLVA